MNDITEFVAELQTLLHEQKAYNELVSVIDRALRARGLYLDQRENLVVVDAGGKVQYSCRNYTDILEWMFESLGELKLREFL